jgi:hypothetical protein
MKVYIIYDMDGWEIRGIDSAFSTREKAEQYLISSYAEYVKQTNGKTVEESWTQEELDDSIVEVEIQ